MTFLESLQHIYKTRKNDEEIINSFYLYSKLSDIRKDTLKDKDLTLLYWKVISQINVPSVLLIKGIKEGLPILKSLYFELNNVSFKDYKTCVYYTVKMIDPNYKFIKTKGEQHG